MIIKNNAVDCLCGDRGGGARQRFIHGLVGFATLICLLIAFQAAAKADSSEDSCTSRNRTGCDFSSSTTFNVLDTAQKFWENSWIAHPFVHDVGEKLLNEDREEVHE